MEIDTLIGEVGGRLIQGSNAQNITLDVNGAGYNGQSGTVEGMSVTENTTIQDYKILKFV